MPNGFIFYRGPSMLDGSPIIAIATGTERATRNVKTGDLIQTWIMRDDMEPHTAAATGHDGAICGDCPHRGRMVDGKNVDRSCYVQVFNSPLSVWRTAQRGIYPTLNATQAALAVDGRAVRIGAYGDPAAVPAGVWQALITLASAHTGYTHQWRAFPALRSICMASCDSAAEQAAAKAQGWRTFRVRTAAEPLATREIVCPSERTSCALCRACGGNAAKARVDIAIVVHGAAGKINAFANRAN